MKLPDFSEFEPILTLRKEMGATRLGHFELFDPHKHLTGEERTKLEQHGVLIQRQSLRLLQDHTLAIKNGRVIVFKLAHESGKKQYYHVANCPVLQAIGDDKLIATTCLHSPFPVLDPHKRRSVSICPDCLTLLGYRGFSLVRNRRIRYSEQLLRQFQLTDFFKLYTLYPVRR